MGRLGTVARFEIALQLKRTSTWFYAAILFVAVVRLRVADNLRVNPVSVMPSYYKTDGLDRAAPAYAGKPILTAQEVEDVVAYLGTLQ